MRRVVEELAFEVVDSSPVDLEQVEVRIGSAAGCLDSVPRQHHRYWHVLNCSSEAELVTSSEELAV